MAAARAKLAECGAEGVGHETKGKEYGRETKRWRLQRGGKFMMGWYCYQVSKDNAWISRLEKSSCKTQM